MLRLLLTGLLLLPLATWADSTLEYTLELEGLNYYDNSLLQNTSLGQGDVQLDFSHVFSRSLRLASSGHLRRSYDDDYKNEENLNEVYVDYRNQHTDIRLGKQIINWSRTDIVNPIDFSSANYRDPLDDDNERYGLIGINVRAYLERANLEWIVLPLHTYSELPELNSPWNPALPQTTQAGQTFRYSTASTDQPKSGLENWQTGIRLSQRGTGFDWAVSYVYGWNDIPQYQQNVIAMNASEVEVKFLPTTHRLHTVAADGALLMDEYTLRSELAYIHTDDSNSTKALVDDPYIHAVVGVDRRFSDVMFNKDLFVLLEYSYQHATTDIQYSPQDFDHIFENTLFMRFAFDDLPRWEFQLDMAYDIANDGQFIRPKFDYEWVDNFKTSIMLEWLDGSEKSFFGAYEDNKSIRIRLTKTGLFF